MEFNRQQNDITLTQPDEQSQNQASSIPLKYMIPLPPDHSMQSMTSGIEGVLSGTVFSSSSSSSNATVPHHPPDNASLPNRSQQSSSLVNPVQTVDGGLVEGYDTSQQRIEGASEGVPTMSVQTTTSNQGMKTGMNEEPDCFSPKKRRRSSAGTSATTTATTTTTTTSTYMPVTTTLDRSESGDGGHAVLTDGSSCLDRKGHAGLRKSTDTRRNNNRVALCDFTYGRRCVLDVRQINPPMVTQIKVVNGISKEKVVRKNKKSTLLDIGQRFGVLQLFVEGHPKSDEKVWVATDKGLVPVPSVDVERAMTQLTIEVREFAVIARGRVRRDPQKQGTRPKAGEPILDCFAIYSGDEGRPLWIESSLITPQIPSTSQSGIAINESQVQLQMPQNQPIETTQQPPPVDSSVSTSGQHGDPPEEAQQQ